MKWQELSSEEQLACVHREIHGRGHAYLVQDKQGRYLVLTQRLNSAAKFLSTLLTDEAPLSSASLYEAINSKKKVGYRFRWLVDKVDIDAAPGVLEKERGRYQHTLYLGQRRHLIFV